MAGPLHFELDTPRLDARLLIVRAPSCRDVADALHEGALGTITAAGARAETVDVPGALEIPTAIRLAQGFDGYVALGCVIRGEAPDYETVCNETARAITTLGLAGLCIGNGILTVEHHAQAMVQAKEQNKGGGAAAAALHLIALARRFGPGHGGSFADPAQEFQIAGSTEGAQA